MTAGQRRTVRFAIALAVFLYVGLLAAAIVQHDLARFVGTTVGLAIGLVVLLLILRRRRIS